MGSGDTPRRRVVDRAGPERLSAGIAGAIRMDRMSIPGRSAAAVMAADLAGSAHTGLDVQLCGDAHVLNFGLWATPERQLSFDLPGGPFEWDLSRVWWCWPVTMACRSPPAAERSAPGCAHIVAECRITRRRECSTSGTAWSRRTICCSRCSNRRSWKRVSARLDKRAKRRTSAGAAPKLPRLVDGRLRIIEDPPIRVRLKDEDSLATTTAFRTTGAICWTNSPSSTWFDRSSGWAVSVWRSIWCCCRGAAPTIRCSCRSNRPDHRCTNPT